MRVPAETPAQRLLLRLYHALLVLSPMGLGLVNVRPVWPAMRALKVGLSIQACHARPVIIVLLVWQPLPSQRTFVHRVIFVLWALRHPLHVPLATTSLPKASQLAFLVQPVAIVQCHSRLR